MKKRALAAALAMLTMATTGTAFAATNYRVAVYRVDVGYNASTVEKEITANHAYIKVNGSNHPERATNYLVTTSSGVQMTKDAFIIPNNDTAKKSNPYKSEYYNYSGACVLRVNSASIPANYTVWGEWNPNG